MKKYLLLTLALLMMAACSKKNEIIISGTIKNAPPLERIELINTASPISLPIANIGTNAQGQFSDTISIDQDGLYAITYGRNMNFIYLKKGENINITAEGMSFPKTMKVTGGDAQKNQDFLNALQEFAENYMSKLNAGIISKEEKPFLEEIKKMQSDFEKKIDELSSKFHPDKVLVDLKKDETNVNFLMIMAQYEAMHGQAVGNPNFKTSPAFAKHQEALIGNEEQWVKTLPTFRSYLLMKYQKDFGAFAEKLKDQDLSITEMFAQFLSQQKNIKQEVKDQLLTFVATQYDMAPNQPRSKQVFATLNKEIKDEQIKQELKKVELAMQGLPEGTNAPDADLINAEGEKFSFSSTKNIPQLVVFYASWSPYISETLHMLVPELQKTYGDQLGITLINMDDTEVQFKKTSTALLKDLPKVTSLYAKGGLKSKTASVYGIYGFKLPSMVVLNKDHKIASPSITNPNDPKLIETLNQLTGITPATPEKQTNAAKK